ncbi:hypothetical protein AB6T38_09650 [Aliiglaciecola sp. SL4]|uniref:hypothetical protein n=1 Tax=Aliiglaciecola sp. SL4 TaxID=3239806 RepID=UPI00355C504B
MRTKNTEIKNKKNFIFYSKYESGHRREYIEYTGSYLGGIRGSLWKGCFSVKPFLFLMLEESPILFFLISNLRSILKLKTVGLVFRAKECLISKSVKHKIKKRLLTYLKSSKYITTYSIVPFYVCEQIKEVCDDWVYDFQFYDLEYLLSLGNCNQKEKFSRKLSENAKNRQIICAIGKQDCQKGFDTFMFNYINCKELREKYLFISGGKIDRKSIDSKLIRQFELAGGIVFDRRVTDSELISMYEVSNYVWACYSPEYDQSSGILGRALQFKKKVIVRKGSVSEQICENLNANYIALPENSDILLSKLETINSTTKPLNFLNPRNQKLIDNLM